MHEKIHQCHKSDYQKKLQAKFKYICIEQIRKYLYSVVTKLAESQTCRKIIKDTQRYIGI